MVKKTLMACLLGGAVALVPAGVSAATIKKCKDADGNWHYGDFAAEQCARSKITEISEGGIKVEERGLQLSAEELEAQRQAQQRAEAQKAAAAAERERDNLLLTTYESEDSIERTRDERLMWIDQHIQINENFVARLEEQLAALEIRARTPDLAEAELTKLRKQINLTLGQIEEYRMATDVKVRERAAMEQRFTEALERYRAARERRLLRTGAGS